MKKPPSLRRFAVPSALVVLSAVLVVGGPASAGSDDYEFGQALVAGRMFDYAKKVFEGMIADPNASAESKDNAKYGLATLSRGEAEAATGGDLPYGEVKSLFDKAVQELSDFVAKNSSHPKADEARLAVGTSRLAFVTWGESLLGDAAEMKDRGGSADQIRADAGKSVEDAINYFDRLRTQSGNIGQLAHLQWVMSQYYRALVLPPCSNEAVTAFKSAAEVLDGFITEKDGYLIAVFAQDILGLVKWKLAECEQDAAKQLAYYDDALAWFKTCIDTENQGDEYLKAITNGYYHYAQLCLAAGRPAGRNYLKQGAEVLSKMKETQPLAWRKDAGIRAMLEYSKILCAMNDPQKAIAVAREAGESAKTLGKGYLERAANRQLGEYVGGGCGNATSSGGGGGSSDPGVLQRVADDLFTQDKYPEAIRAYRQVVANVPDSPQGFVQFGIPAWRKMADAYGRLNDPLSVALSLEPIHDAWMDGRIPHKEGDSADANLNLTVGLRQKAIVALRDLARTTGSKLFKERADAMEARLTTDYPNSAIGGRADWNAALNLFREANEMKARKEAAWKDKNAEARRLFQKIAADNGSEQQDAAWRLVVQSFVLEDADEDAVKAFGEAHKFWTSDVAKKQEEKYPDRKATRRKEIGEATYWKANAEMGLNRSDAVIATLKSYDTDFAGLDRKRMSLATALLIEAHVQKGDLANADAAWKKLLAGDPTFEGSVKLAAKFAGHYEAQYKEIEKKLKEVEGKRKGKDGLVAKVSRATRAYDTSANTLVDKQNRRSKLKQLVAAYNNDPKDHAGIAPGEKDLAEKELLELEPDIAKRQEDLKRFVQEKETAVQALEVNDKEAADLRLKLYGPLTQAAAYYKQWDDTLKANNLSREAANLSAFAYRFYFAATLKPEAPENWANAKSLYEDYLAHADVKDLPVTDAGKRASIARLGDVYVHFALNEKIGSNERQKLFVQAVDRLQSSLAAKSENNAILVGMLAGDYVVLPFNDPATRKTFYYLVPKVADVAAFKAAVAAIGTEGGAPMPKVDVAEQKAYADALNLFKRMVASMEEVDAKNTVDSIRKAGVDWSFYRDLATDTSASPEFRSALARAYVESGRVEDLPKGLSLAESFLGGPLAAEDGSEDWWDAMTLRVRAFLDLAERSPAGAAASGTAAQWLDKAAKLVKGVVGQNPDVGETVRPGTRARWKDLVQRMNVLLGKNGLPAVVVDLSGTAKPISDQPAPGQPAPGQSAPEKPR